MNQRNGAARHAAVVALLLAVVGVQAARSAAQSQRKSTPAAAAADKAARLPAFRDVARSAGIDFTHVNGASDEKFLPEIMGPDGLFLDFDDDGWLDIFLVDGGSFADAAVARRARHRLFRNREWNVRGRDRQVRHPASRVRHGRVRRRL